MTSLSYAIALTHWTRCFPIQGAAGAPDDVLIAGKRQGCFPDVGAVFDQDLKDHATADACNIHSEHVFELLAVTASMIHCENGCRCNTLFSCQVSKANNVAGGLHPCDRRAVEGQRIERGRYSDLTGILSPTVARLINNSSMHHRFVLHKSILWDAAFPCSASSGVTYETLAGDPVVGK